MLRCTSLSPLLCVKDLPIAHATKTSLEATVWTKSAKSM